MPPKADIVKNQRPLSSFAFTRTTYSNQGGHAGPSSAGTVSAVGVKQTEEESHDEVPPQQVPKRRRKSANGPARMAFDQDNAAFKWFEWGVGEDGSKMFKCHACNTGWNYGDAQTAYNHVGMKPDPTKTFLISVSDKKCRHQIRVEQLEAKKNSVSDSAHRLTYAVMNHQLTTQFATISPSVLLRCGCRAGHQEIYFSDR